MLKKMTRDQLVEHDKIKALDSVKAGIDTGVEGPSVCAGFCGKYCGTKKDSDAAMYTANKGYR